MGRVDSLVSVLSYAAETWRGLSDEERPWGMWVTRHASMPEEADELDPEACPALGAWFMDAGGIRVESVDSVRRFQTVIFVQPWCGRSVPEGDTFFEGHTYPIGLAAFAPYAGSSDVYLEMTFGRLHGLGIRLSVDGGVVQVMRELWRS